MFEDEFILGRDVLYIDSDLSYIKDKRVLITGAGGTVGSKLVRYLLFNGAKRIYLLDHSENALYNVYQNNINDEDKLVPILGTLVDRKFVDGIMKKLKSDLVFHTAAYKHVYLCEENPIECIKNNVLGTYNLLNVLDGIEKFIYTSSDKAVESTGIYGISKRICERIVLEKDSDKFVVSRFGNILGSSGSIYDLFKEQIEEGEHVTITHKDATRYFITLEEAVSLLLEIANVGVKNNIYVLNMGDPINIENLARKIAKRMEEDIQIKYIGLRKGERLHEKLYSKNEIIRDTEVKGIKTVSYNSLPPLLDLAYLEMVLYNKRELLEYLYGQVF